ncbi:hypothetical protein [Planococcus lenghuensis]|uniref:hypothetical protein n=1 Tax=Planococcus lenghuensis TaxID=2213202 RepID=UPI0012EB1729|nr:hypothetical protein [Planococcus lenghuensis]
MRNLFMAILGIVVTWLVLGLIPGNFESDFLFAILIGVSLGNTIRKDSEKKTAETH